MLICKTTYLFALAFICQILVSTVLAECRLSDINNIIGGSSYSVEQIVASHVTVDIQNILVITGELTRIDTQEKMGFVYFYDYSFCTVYDQFQFKGVNMGMRDIEIFKDFIIVLGYSQDANGNQKEVIFVFKIYINTASEIRTTFTDIFVGAIPTDQTRIHKGVFFVEKPQTQDWGIIAISKSQIRFYTKDMKVKYYTKNNLTAVSAAVAQSNVVVNYLSSTHTLYSVHSSEQLHLTIFQFKFAQTHGGMGYSLMSMSGSLNNNLFLVSTLYFHGGAPNTTIINLVNLKYQPNNPIKYLLELSIFTIPLQLKVLCNVVDGPSKTIQLVASDAQNRLRLIVVSMDTKKIVLQKNSQPINFLSSFANVWQYDRAVFASQWDTFIFGTSDFVVVENQTFRFKNKVGYVIGLEKNRINKLIEETLPNDMLTISDQTAILEYNQPSQYILSQTIQTTQDMVTQYQHQILALAKNEWTKELYACQPYMITYNSDCYNYAFLQHFSNFTASNAKNVPNSNNCNISKTFGFQTYSHFTSSEKNIRATCYPFFQEIQDPTEVPYDQYGRKMLIIDKSALTVSWNTTVNDEVAGNTWSYYGLEAVDDVGISHLKGYEANAKFSSYLIENKSIQLFSNLDWVYPLSIEPLEDAFVQCWSDRCPNFIQYDSTEKTFRSSKSDTINRPVSGTYIYYVELRQKETSAMNSRFTLTLVMTIIQVEQKININLPFEIWAIINKGNLPYYIPPSLPSAPQSQQIEKGKIQNQFIDQFQDQMEKQTVDALASWSDQEIQEAFKEALERVQKPLIDIQTKVKMSNTGLVTISFSSPISIPSYLLREFKSKTQKEQRMLNVFFENSTFKINDNLGAQPKRGFEGNQIDAQAYVPQTPKPKNETSTQNPQIQPSTGPVLQTPQTQGQNTQNQKENKPKNDTISESGQEKQPKESLQGGNLTTQDKSISGDKSKEAKPGSSQKDQNDKSEQRPSGQRLQDFISSQYMGPRLNQPIISNNQEQQSSNLLKTNAKQQLQCLPIQYLDKKSQKCEFLEIYFGSFDSLFSVQIMNKQKEDQSPRRQLDQLYSKRIISFEPSQITVQFNFSDPLSLSPSDLIEVEFNFGSFEKGMAKNFVIQQPCTRQIVEGSAVNTVVALSQASTAATTAAVVGSTILKTLMNGCLAQVWGMINGVQMLIYMPAMNVAFPSNAFVVISKILLVASFDIPYISMASIPKIFRINQNQKGELLGSTDQQNIKNSFGILGYDSVNMSDNLGSLYIIVLFTIILLLLSALMTMFKFEAIVCCKRSNQYLKKKLHWNFVIRLVIEGSFDFTFAIFFNLRYTYFSVRYWGSFINYIITCVLSLVLIALPIFILVFYTKNFSKLHEPEFEAKYGSVYEGLKLKSRSSLVYNCYFVIRRCFFMLTSLILYGNVLLQLFIVILMTLIACCYIMLYMPFEDTRQNRLEVMNECITLCITYLCIGFTDIISEPRTQYLIGFFFIFFFCLCIFVHLFFLFKDSINLLLRKIKAKLNQKRRVKPLETKIIEDGNKDISEISEEQSESNNQQQSSSQEESEISISEEYKQSVESQVKEAVVLDEEQKDHIQQMASSFQDNNFIHSDKIIQSNTTFIPLPKSFEDFDFTKSHLDVDVYGMFNIKYHTKIDIESMYNFQNKGFDTDVIQNMNRVISLRNESKILFPVNKSQEENKEQNLGQTEFNESIEELFNQNLETDMNLLSKLSYKKVRASRMKNMGFDTLQPSMMNFKYDKNSVILVKEENELQSEQKHENYFNLL